MKIPSWCTPCFVPLITLLFEPLENLSLSSLKYARYVTISVLGVRSLILQGGAIHAFQPRCPSVYSRTRSPIALSADTLIGTVRGKISCSTRQICIPIRSTRLLWGEVKIFATRSGDIRGPGARQDISSSTWVFPVNMILLTGHLSTSLSMVVIGPHRNIKTARHHVTHFLPTCTTLEIWSVNIMCRYASTALQRDAFLTVPRAAGGSSSWRRLLPIWFKKTLGSAPTWMKSFPVFLRSRKSSVRGNYAPELPTRMRYGSSRRGGLLVIGAEPWATSSQIKLRFPSRTEQYCLLAPHTAGFILYVVCRTLRPILCAFLQYPLSFLLSSLICSSQLITFVTLCLSVIAWGTH
jgi:hypothetical protein